VVDAVRAAWGVTVRDAYGQTELTALIGNVPGVPVRRGSMGRVLPGYEVALLDPRTGEPAEEGEICVDLASDPIGVMRGYLGDPEKNERTFAGGWYHTGDIGRRDADGYVHYVGRTDDVFKSYDHRISPFELESVLLEHDAVAEAAVVPAPDPVGLVVPKAYVALAAGIEAGAGPAADILRHAQNRLAPHQWIRRLAFVELPKTTSGKIRRAQLRGLDPAGAGQEYVAEELLTMSAPTAPGLG
jgi:acetyl-CoA synthetase